MMPSFFRRAWACFKLCLIFIRELVLSSWTVACAALAPTHKNHPAIIAYPLRVRTDLAIATLANLISLTPGTTSLQVSDDHSTLYVHCLDVESEAAVVSSIRNAFEEIIMEIEG